MAEMTPEERAMQATLLVPVDGATFSDRLAARRLMMDQVALQIIAAERAAAERMRERCADAVKSAADSTDDGSYDFNAGVGQLSEIALRIIRALPLEP